MDRKTVPGDKTPKKKMTPRLSNAARDEHVRRIEAELRLANDRVAATIKELESANKELKSSNKEYQSINRELHSANKELETSQERQQLLLAELQHRVKNILAVVRSLARRTAERADSIEDFTAHFDGRLSAMARIQNILVRTAEGGVDLAEMVHEELVGYAAHYIDQVDVKGPEIKLRPKPAETLSLAIHELTTNAVKYGALSTPSGHISISWQIGNGAGDARLAFDWQESGVPIMNQEPSRSGFGRELIERGLPYDLKATTALEFRRGGIRCLIELPFSDKIAFREKS